MITPEQIIEDANQRFSGTVIHNAWGEHGLFYNPGQVLKRGVYIMTVKLKDGENDRASDLAREGIYRINTGIRKDTFRKLFGDLPGRPKAGGIVDMNYDFTSTNLIMPHPVYARMG